MNVLIQLWTAEGFKISIYEINAVLFCSISTIIFVL
uniref:Uncharacterized protein n=1 Tax=Anguilla anguilla TaxID=7936 RepID=A0A0E9PXU7_ANGAN